MHIITQITGIMDWKNKNTLLIAVFFMVLVNPLADALPVSAQEVPLIKVIELKGNQRIEDDTIYGKISSAVGDHFSDDTVQKDVKDLYGIGYFDDVRVEIAPFEGGLKLIYLFDEKPTIRSIDFQGNDKIKTEDLKERITVTPGAIANPSLITDNINSVTAYYQSEGFWHVQVIPVVNEVSRDSVSLTFLITEGAKVVIRNISIEGNRAVSDRKIKKAMKTRKRWFLSFITGSGYYRKDEMRQDIERIRELYHSKGFLYVAISEPEVTLNPEKTRMFIKISISEGETYSVGRVDIRGNTLFNRDDLLQRMDTSPGKIVNKTALRRDIDRLIEMHTEKGYARADIVPEIKINDEEKVANVTLSIIEGEIYRIGRIEITGNSKTRDKVIRREVRLDEGDIFNSSLLKRSYQRINNLDYFEKASITPSPREDRNLIDLDIDVQEKLTGMMSVGGGYSSVDKFMFMAEITQRNLFGKGLYLSLKANLSALRTDYNISLRDPWFMDKPISASLSLYNESFDYPDYDKKATGGYISFGKELSEYVRGSIRYTLEEAEVTDIAEDASFFITEQEGKAITSSVSPSIWRDTRDNYLDPTSGSRNALNATIAGLGGDNYFAKGLIDSLWYFPAKWGTAVSFRARFGYAAGYAGEELPVYERFYVGGINTVRGLGFGEAGPRNEEGEVIGGETEMIFNTEFIFPLAKEIKLKGLVFFDAGRSFDEDEDISFSELRTTTGFGVRWISPFGPIRLEWGYNLSPEFDESNSKIEFSMGTLF
jgi:outer membrane protein insertion porin family